MSPTDQRARALTEANAQRARQAQLRSDMIAGRLTLAEIMAQPPPDLARTMLIDVIRMMRSSVSARRSSPVMTRIGREAVAAGVNLLVPLGDASVRSRAWVAAHGGRGMRPRSTQDAALEFERQVAA